MSLMSASAAALLFLLVVKYHGKSYKCTCRNSYNKVVVRLLYVSAPQTAAVCVGAGREGGDPRPWEPVGGLFRRESSMAACSSP